jgi:predicted Zn-dependent protease
MNLLLQQIKSSPPFSNAALDMSRQQQFGSIPRLPPRGTLPTYVWGPSSSCYLVALSWGTALALTESLLPSASGFLQHQQRSREYRKSTISSSLERASKARSFPDNHRASQTVHRVGSRIAQATQEFCKEHHLKHMANTPFTYTVVRSEQANAFVLPGDGIFVLTGLPICS